mmetsp:Transcript_20810/g.61554  ORF Transcript_20810/g.61554 Transcript_20810/m.61554 type:complete len:257 (-) Transcript_20810:260-1030(-)
MGSYLMGTILGVFEFLETQGPVGVAYYSVFLCVWTICCLPTTPLEIAAGFVFMPVASVVASVAGKTVGSVVSFTLGRVFLSPLLARTPAGIAPSGRGVVARTRRLTHQLQHMLATHPAQTIAMVRASPMPIFLKNFGLSLMPADVVSTSLFAGVTLIVNIPYSIAWSLTGHSAGSLQEAVSGEGAPRGPVLAKLGVLVALFAFLGLFARYAKRTLAAASTRLTSPMRRASDPAPKAWPAPLDGMPAANGRAKDHAL